MSIIKKKQFENKFFTSPLKNFKVSKNNNISFLSNSTQFNDIKSLNNLKKLKNINKLKKDFKFDNKISSNDAVSFQNGKVLLNDSKISNLNLFYKSNKVFQNNLKSKKLFTEFNNKSFKKINFIRRSKSFKKFRSFLFSTISYRIQNQVQFKSKLNIITINYQKNNLFCSYTYGLTKKTIFIGSSGKCKIKMTSRLSKHVYRDILNVFFKNLKKQYNIFNETFIRITAPTKAKKHIVKYILQKFNLNRKKRVCFEILPKKCYNGCKVSKQIKKKRRNNFFRVFK